MQQKTEEERARAYVLFLLARRGYFEQEIREKMRRKGYSAEIIEKMITLCVQKGYINDEARVKNVIESKQARGRGPRRIALELRAKGALTERTARDLQMLDQRPGIMTLHAKLKRRALTREKIIRMLMQRGFDLDKILSCLDENSNI
ncbi:MAG: regulatory protein RecX [Chlamydiales bacterium]